MSGNGNQVPLAPNQRGSISYSRASTPHRPVEYYHPTGAAGGAYMPSTSGGAQATGQASLRVQPTQPSAPPTPQQDMSKTSMAGHNYVSQNQTAPPRNQYTNFPYRPSQHTLRPTTLPRQQQSFISGAATSTGPVMFPILLPPIPLSVQTYSQPRSNTQYYQYHPYVTGYNNSSSGHTPQYYYSSNSPQLPTPNPQTNTSGRSNPTTMVGPQGTTTTPTAPTASIPHQQQPTHMHHTIPGIRNTLPKRTHRLPIIDPETQQDILSDLYSNDSYNDSSNRQTPQPEPSHSIAEEFTRRVNEVAKQHSGDSATKWNYGPTNADVTVSSTPNTIQTQPNAIISNNNNNNNKSEILTINECKSLGPDIAVETNETPIVSAISDSPVIVPKMPLNVKQFQKNSDQSLVIESNKSFTQNKQLKNKNVPQIEDVETCSGDILIVPASAGTTCEETSASTPITSYTQTNILTNPQVPAFNPLPGPQPQRIREPRDKTNDKKEEKNKIQDLTKETETSINSSIPNGPVPPVAISSVDSLSNAINPPTSQSHHSVNTKSTSNLISRKQSVPASETIAIIKPTFEVVVNNEQCVVSNPVLTPTELLSASIEKVVKDQQQAQLITETREVSSSASEAQAKLTQSLSSVLRSNQAELTMKDINVNNKSTDPDTANGNNIELNKTEDTTKDDVNKNEIPLKTPSSVNTTKMTNNDVNEQVTDSYENGNETDKVDIVEQDKPLPVEEDIETIQTTPEKSETSTTTSPTFVPKYKYSEDQWSPINREGKKSYGIGLLKQIKDDPMSKNRPLIPSLELCNVLRTSPMQESVHIPNVARSINDSLFPTFAKGSGMGSRNNTPRDPKKDGRSMAMPGRGGSMKMAMPSGGPSHKPVIHVRLHDDVKLNEVDSAWKPTRFRQENIDEEELKTQELYKKFRGILNKLTPQKFDTLLDRIKTLEINNQKRLEGVIDLVFEKAIDEPNFSEAYAAMCNKLSKLKVPADNASNPDQCVNFRALIINKCQNQFEADKVDSHVVKLEKDLAECTDPVKKKELVLMLDEEQRRVRMRSVGNVRFIGELYKLKMLTSKIMEYCMKQLIDKLEEEKLECLCKLLTTIGEQIESEVSGQLDNIFKKMQEIVDRKSNKISSRVRFMIQDVIELRKRKWYVKSVIDSQPKMMDQIQKEAEQQQRHIELMNASPSGGFRRDDGGRGKRGDSRRQNSNNSFNDGTWKPPRTTNFPVDTTKLKAVTQKNLRDIKLAPHNSAWNQGSGTKNTAQNAGSSNSMISISKNMYSMLENVQADPTSLRGTRDMTPSYHSKGASIERSTFNSRAGDTSRSGSVTLPRSNSGTRSASVSLPNPAATTEQQAAPSENVPAEPLPPESNCLMTLIRKFMRSCVVEEFVSDIVDQAFPVQYHVAVIKEICNITLDFAPRKFDFVARAFESLITSKVFSPENFLAGLQETLELSPELFIDIPMLYENLGNLIAPHIAKKLITFADIHKYSENIISSNHGHLFLKATFRNIKERDGTVVGKSRWQESGMQLKQWMDESQIPKWMSDNNLEYLEENSKLEVKLLQLMKADESYDHIKGWVKENMGKSSNEDWFMRSLIQAICEYALIGPDGREMPHFNQDRMNKYARLIHEFGETKQSREASCLFGIQQLIRKREYPQGLALVIFQYLHEQYIISLDGFIEWEKSEKEPEGKAVMLKMLTSFFTNIKEADNEDSCSED